jgi:TPP-dependent 2-oxoacid decarboxylase
MPSSTVGSFLFQYLYDQGIHHAFGIPGDFALPTFRWLAKSPIELITMVHEPGVGFAADAYSRAHGGLGLAVVTYCVGGLNMLNAIAGAYAEKSPVIVVSGGPSPADRRHDPLVHHKVRTFDTQRRIYDEVTCASTVLLDQQTAADEIIRVVRAARIQCRPGYIEVPFDVVDLPIGPASNRIEQAIESDSENLAAAVAEAVELISRAKRPVIIADVELHRHGLTDLALGIARRINIPIASTLLSKSIISETNPLFIGVYSGGISAPECQAYVENSDCVFLLGAFLSDVFMGMKTATLNRRQTILANTERLSIGYHSYENVRLADFLRLLAEQPIAPKKFDNPYKPAIPQPLSDAQRDEPLDASAFFQILGLTMQENSTLVCDVGDALFGAIELRTHHQADFLANAYYLSMGFAAPAIVGATAAKPGSRVYAIIGDGAFQMTGAELSTCAKYQMKPIVCILNNDGYGTQRKIIDGPFNDIHRWQYAKFRDVLDYGRSVKVHTKGELERALLDAAATDEMFLIEVILPRDSASEPMQRFAEALAKLRDREKQA